MVAGGNGFLAIHNLQTRQTKVLTIFKERISIRAIAYESNSNNYWLGTANGLYICDHNFNIIKHFASKFKNTKVVLTISTSPVQAFILEIICSFP